MPTAATTAAPVACPLSPAQIEQFRTQGYTTAPTMFSPAEVAVMQAEIQRLVDAGKLRNVATIGDGKTTSTTAKNLQICPLSPASEVFRALPYDDRVVSAIRALVGDPVTFWLDQIFLKPGGDGAGTSWHQDNAYFKAPKPLCGVGMWTAVHAASKANGTMHIIPGLGQKLNHSRDPGSDHHIRCVVDESKAVAIELPAGGSLFFAYDIPHCTRANTTANPRAGLALHFAHESQNQDADREEYRTAQHLTGPQADGGLARWGRDQRGAWARFSGR